jgi:hypothetical protein
MRLHFIYHSNYRTGNIKSALSYLLWTATTQFHQNQATGLGHRTRKKSTTEENNLPSIRLHYLLCGNRTADL